MEVQVNRLCYDYSANTSYSFFKYSTSHEVEYAAALLHWRRVEEPGCRCSGTLVSFSLRRCGVHGCLLRQQQFESSVIACHQGLVCVAQVHGPTVLCFALCS